MKTVGNKIELFDEDGNSRGFYDLRNQLNDLTGKEWVFSTKSVIPKSFPPSFQQKLRNSHGGQKPPELCAQLIQTFTKKKQTVLDPFCGVGGTLVACSLTERKGLGIEHNREWVEIYHKVCDLEKIEKQEIVCADSRVYLKNLKRSFDFILTDVPFWLMDKAPKSKGTYKKVGEPARGVYSERSKLSKFDDTTPTTKEEWKDLLYSVFKEAYRLLKNKKYCAVFIGNMYHDGKYHLLNSDLTTVMEQVGFILKGEIIWYDVGKKLHLYGINYSWIPSIVHQFIMVYRKEE
ncbi:MAG: TRM11 family SAM-dependent methyltransferase [Candidatus Helarchaeales archaeon]